MVYSSLLCLAAALLAQAPAAGPGARPAVGNPRLEHCIVTLFEEVQVPASVPGKIIAIPVREGGTVKAGTLVAQLDAREVTLKKKVTEIEYQVAQKQAAQDVKVKVAEASMKVAAQELDQGKRLASKTPPAISDSEMRRLELAYDRARYEHEAAKVENEIQQEVVKAREAQIESADHEIFMRRIESPAEKPSQILSGTPAAAPRQAVWIVEKLLKHVGEWVSPGDPVLTLVEMDQVKVESFLNATQYSPVEVFGKPVRVEVLLERGRKEVFSGVIGYVSTKVDASGEYRVWAAVENTPVNGNYLLRSGLKATMTIDVTGRGFAAQPATGLPPR